MYDRAMMGGGAATMAGLPFTGFNAVWFLLAAFTLLMAGGALARLAPRIPRWMLWG